MVLTGGRAVMSEQLDTAQRAYEQKRNELGLNPLLSIDGIPTSILKRELDKTRKRVQSREQKLIAALNTVEEISSLMVRIPKLPVEVSKDTAKIMQIVAAWRSQVEASLPSYDDQLMNQIRNDWLDQKQKMSMLMLLLKRAQKYQGMNPRKTNLVDIVSEHREDAAERFGANGLRLRKNTKTSSKKF